MKYLLWLWLASTLLASPGAFALEVSCNNDVGSCTIGESSGECDCLSGNDSGWSDGYNPDDPPKPDATEEELMTRCEKELLSSCGDSIPAPADECSPESLEICSQFVTNDKNLDDACISVEPVQPVTVTVDENGETVIKDFVVDIQETDEITWDEEQPNPWQVIDCCGELEQPSETSETMVCIAGLEDGDCDGYDECIGFDELGSPESSGESFGIDRDVDEEGSDNSAESDQGASSTNSESEDGESSEPGAKTDEADDDSDGGCTAVPLSNSHPSSLLTLIAEYIF